MSRVKPLRCVPNDFPLKLWSTCPCLMSSVSRSVVLRKESVVRLSWNFLGVKFLANFSHTLVISRGYSSSWVRKLMKKSTNSPCLLLWPLLLTFILPRPFHLLVATALNVLCFQDHTAKAMFYLLLNLFKIMLSCFGSICLKFPWKALLLSVADQNTTVWHQSSKNRLQFCSQNCET